MASRRKVQPAKEIHDLQPDLLTLPSGQVPSRVVERKRYCHYEGNGAGCYTPARYSLLIQPKDGAPFSYGSCERHLELMKRDPKWSILDVSLQPGEEPYPESSSAE